MKSFKELEEAFGRRHDAYTRDYHSSISGMHKHHSAAYHADGGANDEGWDREHHHKPADHPHSVHINGKKWKTFGSHSHATNVARKIKGATVHKEEVQLDEISDKTLMNYAQKVHDDSLKHDKDPTKRSPEKRNKSVMGFSRAINKLESRPHKEEVELDEKMTDTQKTAVKAINSAKYGKQTPSISQTKETIKFVKEEETPCPVCNQDPCACEDSHGFVKTEEHLKELSTELLARYKKKAGEAASAADKKGDYATGNKRFKGINKATNKQFDNDLKKESVKSPGVGWMLKQDPKLGAIIKARKEKYKSFKQHVGKKIEDKKDEK